ncbi:MAG: ferritin [Candidatus Thorarchaeota archaeon]
MREKSKIETSKKLQDAINEQINFELYSACVYLSMATWLESRNLSGMGHWMEVQVQEEYAHAMRFYRHVVERGGRVILKEMRAPKTEWSSLLEVFEDALAHESEVTRRIHKIGEIADEEGDRAAQSMLSWFYDERVEEEAQIGEIRDLLKMTGDNLAALLHINAKLGARAPMSPPPAESTAPQPLLRAIKRRLKSLARFFWQQLRTYVTAS